MNISLNNAHNQPIDLSKETRIKKAAFRSHHRGSKEMDLVMGQFAEKHLAGLSAADLTIYEQLLDEEDNTLWEWVIGRTQPSVEHQHVVELLKKYAPLVD